ncbi:NAD(P)-binding protein [Gonapodya prolifera JEL478]|uniref:NAD(P)-binding protein n=1 Tax=Gonapodya prolifera (strain JEL478) TaxID=1344416 RepID=A0A139ASW6_GONPJ|nr:NAD(P)-binding protein [Gonapodya prolifera JEL478]|eukprot:KXS19820.1 NAD(P)-binding protein [Gonapodya prolifera JEL478]
MQQQQNGGKTDHYPGPGEFSKQTQLDKNPGPGIQREMEPKPISTDLPTRDGLQAYKAAKKLDGKVALITGGDSGIGRAVAVLFAKESCNLVAIAYLPEEDKDAQETKALVEREGCACLLVPTDLSKGEGECARVIRAVLDHPAAGGKINVLVSNAATQTMLDKIEDISEKQLERTFKTNVYPMFYFAKHAVPHMSAGDSILNTTSVTAYKGSPRLVDYSATKGAIVSFTRSLAKQLAPKGIRCNAVAPGPIWTPLQPVSRPPDGIEQWTGEGSSPPLGRLGQPAEVATSYVFLASADGSYFAGQVFHPNGGDVVNG